MEAYEEYYTKLKYPTSKEYTKYWVYHMGEVLYETEFGEVLPERYKDNTTEKYVDKNAFSEAQIQYRNDSDRLLEKFKNDLFADLEISNNPKKDIFYDKVLEITNTDDLGRIYDIAYGLVDLIIV